MAGHNKWSKIKHKKAITDLVKSKVYSKYNKLIQIAIREANGNVDSVSVQSAIERARSENVPKENIDKAIKKATGVNAQSLSEVLYEGFDESGCGILIKAITDNTNRTVTEIKTILAKNNGSFASSGAVSWGFTKDAKMDWIPNIDSKLKISSNDGEKLKKLIDLLEENDDITDVYTNAIY